MRYLNLETYGDKRVNLKQYLPSVLMFIKTNSVGLIGILLSFVF